MDGHDHRRRSMPRGTLSVAVVLAVAGLLITANARLARNQEERPALNLAQLVEAESERSVELAAEVESLRQEVEELTDVLQADSPPRSAEVALAETQAGRTAVTGPGIVVSLDDAPAVGPRPAGIRNDDLIVHQQDVQAVINALWAGGAEAMMLQDQRVTSRTAFRCVGNVLLLHGRQYSPPYLVTAIGNAESMRAALSSSPAVQRYLEYVEAVGLGWSVTDQQGIVVPGYEGSMEMRYARVPEGVNVL